MNVEDTAKSVGTVLAFSGVAWFSDVVSLGISSMQYSVLGAMQAAVSGPQVIITAGVGFAVWLADIFTGTQIIGYVQGLLGVIFGLQMLVSLLTLCVFYAIVLISPRGTYSFIDCLVAAAIFLLEAMPLLCSFTFWGGFAVYLRRREVSGVVGKVVQTAGLTGGTGKGSLSGVLKVLKK